MVLLKTIAGYFVTQRDFNFEQRECLVSTYSIIHVKEISLLEIDKAKLVQIYAKKLTSLTKKQRVIFDLLSGGMKIKEIAQDLGIAEITVKVVKARIMLLLGVTTLQEMAVIAQCSSCNYVKHTSHNQ
jgi:DNA-binding NarL/FixJ family response regulator